MGVPEGHTRSVILNHVCRDFLQLWSYKISFDFQQINSTFFQLYFHVKILPFWKIFILIPAMSEGSVCLKFKTYLLKLHWITGNQGKPSLIFLMKISLLLSEIVLRLRWVDCFFFSKKSRFSLVLLSPGWSALRFCCPVEDRAI